MIKFYHKIFYHLYKLAIKTGEQSAPLTSVIPTLAFLQSFNLMVLGLILEFLDFRVVSYALGNESSKIYLIVGYLLLAGINYLYFTSEDRYKKLVKEYSKKPLPERKKGARITLVYSLVSIALIFILAPLRVM